MVQGLGQKTWPLWNSARKHIESVGKNSRTRSEGLGGTRGINIDG